jgi:hypothetical protein
MNEGRPGGRSGTVLYNAHLNARTGAYVSVLDESVVALAVTIITLL